MVANDLMIGDWIFYGEKPVKVLQLSEGKIYRGFYPILLTSEILEKNGWVKVEADGVFYPKQFKGELPYIVYATDGEDWRFRVRDFCDIEYVHQLQHALKLCGIDKEIVLQ